MYRISKNLFGQMPDGKNVFIYTLSSDNVTAKVLNYGGTLQSLIVDGVDIVCGYDSLDAYRASYGYHGATVGRYANRICDGKFVLDGVEYQLEKNEHDTTHLHGGKVGFDKKIWKVASAMADEKKACLVLVLFSPDMEECYPGNLNVKVTFTVSGKDFSIRYEALSDKKTILNMTNHSYFNMNGYDSEGSIESQSLAIFADTYSEVNEVFIPTCDSPVENTPFDFRVMKLIGNDINSEHPQTVRGGGYDHNFNFSGDEFISYQGRKLRYGAVMAGKVVMHLYTDMPAVQFYSGNSAGGPFPFKAGIEKTKRRGMCLETQFKPNSPNNGGGSILEAGEKYDYTTLLRFE